MILDDAITAAMAIALAVSLLSKKSALLSTLLLSSHAFNLYIFQSSPEWGYFVAWLYIIIIKDLLVICALGFMTGVHSLIIMLTFAASCIFHQLILAQANTGIVDNLTLLDVRPELMKIIVVVQLATIYHAILGGGDSGGKRAKSGLFYRNNRRNSFFCLQAYKVKQ